MKSVFRTAVMSIVFSAACGVMPCLFESSLLACPGCKNANETESLRPRAYMYSILFMLGMPATVFAGFGIAFYRMSRRAAIDQQEAMEQLGLAGNSLTESSRTENPSADNP